MIIAAITDLNYIPLAVNWYRSLRRVGLSRYAMLYCTDTESTNIAEKNKIPHEYVQKESLDNNGTIVTIKSSIIRELIDKVDHIIMSDVDIVFTTNIVNDILSMHRSSDLLGSQISLPGPHICGGFYSIKSNPKMKEFFNWEYVSSFENVICKCPSIKKLGGMWDEVCINFQLGIYPPEYRDVRVYTDRFNIFPNLEYTLLDPNRYRICPRMEPPRWRRRKLVYQKTHRQCDILHFAFQRGLNDKIKAMKLANAWYDE